MINSRSRELYDRALSVMPGGVNSSVRAVHPYPEFVRRGEGGHVIGMDGDRYIDYVMGYGPLLYGHDLPDRVRASVQSAVSDGPMFGVPTEVEVELAEFVTRHVPSVDLIRFVNSGTEATVSAIRLARGYTGRDKIVVMNGGYHGANDSTLVEGEPGATKPSSEGIPESFAKHTLSIPFNDIESVQAVFSEYGDTIAAVLTEPILGNTGIVTPNEGFHEELRKLCDDYGSLLIFDEVITGFRVGGLSCAQGKFGVTPDITTFGKIVGGGFPVGAIGGTAEIMESFTPVGQIFQSGTFSGHPVTMAAGLETLRYAAENDVYDHINQLGEQLREGLRTIVTEKSPAYTVVGTESLFKVIFTRRGSKIRDGSDVKKAQRQRWDRLFRPGMKEQGILLTANQLEAQFLCYGHTETDIEETLAAYEAVL